MPAKLTVPETIADDSHVSALVDFGFTGTRADAETKGLTVRIGPRSATFYYEVDVQVRGERTHKRMMIGRYPGTSLTEARRLAAIERGKVASGDIQPGKNQAQKIGAAMADYLDHLKVQAEANGKPPRHWRNSKYLYDQLIEPTWAAWSLHDAIGTEKGRRALSDWHRKVTKDNGPTSANHAARLLRSSYQYAARFNVSLPKIATWKFFRWNTERPAQTAMAPKSYPDWLAKWNGIRAQLGHNRPVRHFAPTRKEFHLFGLLTGARPGEISRLRWQDVKPTEREVVIPNAKKGADIHIILSAPIARVLKRCRDITKPNKPTDLIFPHTGQVASRDDLPAAGHALRHNYITLATALHVPATLVSILVGHVPEGMTASYVTETVMLQGDALRAAQRKISARIVKLLGSDPTK